MDGKSELDKPTQTEQENAEGKKLLELSEDDGEAQRKVERKKKFGKEAREWVILIACTLRRSFRIEKERDFSNSSFSYKTNDFSRYTNSGRAIASAVKIYVDPD